MANLQRIVKFYPAFDKRDPDPSKNYGIGGVSLLMLVKGEKGAAQFTLSTNWHLPHVTEDTLKSTIARAQAFGASEQVQVSEDFGGMADVSERMESAKRMIGMSRPYGLDEIDLKCRFLPLPTDLGYHSFTPRYEDQTCISESCEWLDGKPCYYDGSGLNAERIYDVLLKEGDEGVWRELEIYYMELFEQEETK